ncbi:MAG: hypothetical protein U1F43_34035 [Myxococcota bacterium]
MCSFDCWPWVRCLDGVVETAGGGFWDGPCGSEPEHCPSPRRHMCQGGCGLATRCDADMNYLCGDQGCDLDQFCVSGRPGRLGDECASDADCRWTCAPIDPAVGKLHQACDAASNTCVAVAPPAAADIGASCGLGDVDVAAVVSPWRPVVVGGVAACASGLCVVRTAPAGSPSTAEQTCTAACDGDDACPGEAWCVPAVTVGDGRGLSVCALPR